MSLTDHQRAIIVDYFFKHPNAKAVLEDGLEAERVDVDAFMEKIHDHLTRVFLPAPKEIDTVIEIPKVSHFRFGHGRDVVRKRSAKLEKVDAQIRQAQMWHAREVQYLQLNCNHSYKPTGDGDGSSQSYCQDCGHR